MIPETIAHYRITSKLGEGAMGKVYRATDSKLGREVAIKVIPEDFAADPGRMSRFTREAQVLASLNHPNIAAIYAVEDRALIMELVEGPTLAERIGQGAIPLDEALAFARQIADGLSAAHDKGIVHRDLKPANIKITPDGTIKVLDFGLAKADSPWTGATSVEDAPTLTVATTGAGVIVGTAAYMSPEQARGKQVDKRADIWAFGAIVYEMITGSRLFAGETITDVLASVVQRDPDLSRVPSNVQRLLRRCLEKDAKQRLRDASDAMLLLDAGDGVAAKAPAQRGLLLGALGVAAVLLIALTWLAFTHFRETPPAEQVLRFQIGLPDRVQFTQFGVVTISPDGSKVAFAAYGDDGRPRVWIRALDSSAATPLAEATINQVPYPFFWSPDSRFVAFEQAGKLKKIAVEGGVLQDIAASPKAFQGQWVYGGSWNRDNVIIIGTDDGIMRVSADGGALAPVTTADKNEPAHWFPTFLPDGRRFLYLRGGEAGSRYIAVGDLNTSSAAQPTTQVVKTDLPGLAVPTEGGKSLKLLFQREATVFAQDFDERALAVTGEPMPIVERVGGIIGMFSLPLFSASNTGTLVYRIAAGDGGRQLTWFNRDGQVTGTPGEPGPYGIARVSPDGSKAAVVPNVDLRQQPPNHDIWIADLVKGTNARLTFDTASDRQPVWSPDGKWIAWEWRDTKQSAFLRKAADGSGTDERLDMSDNPRALTDWTQNGHLIFTERGNIWALPVESDATGKRTPVAVVNSPANEYDAHVSPDNRWIAYLSNETGRQELFVQPFALGRGATAGKWQVSVRGTMGTPRWRSDSKELTFVSGDGKIVAVDVASETAFQAGAPRPLFQLPRELYAIINQNNLIDATRDNQRFLVIMPVQERSQREIGVFVNWASALRR